MTCDYDPTDNPFLTDEHRAECMPHEGARVYVFTRRPSDPAELCAVLGLCEACALADGWSGPDLVIDADSVPSIATYAQAEAWFERHAQAHRLLWLS